MSMSFESNITVGAGFSPGAGNTAFPDIGFCINVPNSPEIVAGVEGIKAFGGSGGGAIVSWETNFILYDLIALASVGGFFGAVPSYQQSVVNSISSSGAAQTGDNGSDLLGTTPGFVTPTKMCCFAKKTTLLDANSNMVQEDILLWSVDITNRTVATLSTIFSNAPELIGTMPGIASNPNANVGIAAFGVHRPGLILLLDGNDNGHTFIRPTWLEGYSVLKLCADISDRFSTKFILCCTDNVTNDITLFRISPEFDAGHNRYTGVIDLLNAAVINTPNTVPGNVRNVNCANGFVVLTTVEGIFLIDVPSSSIMQFKPLVDPDVNNVITEYVVHDWGKKNAARTFNSTEVFISSGPYIVELDTMLTPMTENGYFNHGFGRLAFDFNPYAGTGGSIWLFGIPVNGIFPSPFISVLSISGTRTSTAAFESQVFYNGTIPITSEMIFINDSSSPAKINFIFPVQNGSRGETASLDFGNIIGMAHYPVNGGFMGVSEEFDVNRGNL